MCEKKSMATGKAKKRKLVFCVAVMLASISLCAERAVGTGGKLAKTPGTAGAPMLTEWGAKVTPENA